MKVIAAFLVGVPMALASAGSASARWSAPRSFMASSGSISALAVDARGDAAVAWATRGNPGAGSSFATSLHVTVRTVDGRLSTRTVWSSDDAQTQDVSVVLGAGAVTVAWDTRSRVEARGATSVIHAAYGPLIGRWRPARAIRRVPYEPVYEVSYVEQQQRLAIAPDGEVLLAFHARAGSWLAWRAPGHRFGAPRLMRAAPGEATPQFDARGTAYLSGSCSGLVQVARPRSRRFSHTVVLTDQPVFSFTLALDGAGRGVAAWATGECEGHMPGPVSASVLNDGRFGRPLVLTPTATQAVRVGAVAGPAADTVVYYGGGAPDGWPQASTVLLAAGGATGATQTLPVNAPVAVACDGGGDLVFEATPGPRSGPVFVRPASGAADEPAPSSGLIAVAAPVGRAVAVAWNTSAMGVGPTMALSVWRP